MDTTESKPWERPQLEARTVPDMPAAAWNLHRGAVGARGCAGRRARAARRCAAAAMLNERKGSRQRWWWWWWGGSDAWA